MPIASTAVVHPSARIHPSTIVGEYAIVEGDVELGPNNRLDPFSIVKRYTTMGEGNHLYAGAQVGMDPLDKKFKEEDRSYIRIGNFNVFREYMTISRGTAPESETVMGDNNYIMTGVHVAHNGRMGNNITICSNTVVGGHVTMEDNCFVSGGVAIHQFCNIGRLAMLGGNSKVVQDIPPYVMISDFDAAAHGLNLVGMRRAGVPRATIVALKQAYRLLYRAGLPRQEALAQMESLGTPEVLHLVEFIRKSKRGICPDYQSDLRKKSRFADGEE